MTTATLTLTDFLLARIADDEERAQFVARQIEGQALFESWRLSWHDEYDLLCVEPRRALAEVESKRKMVAAHGESPTSPCARHPEYCRTCDGLQSWPCPTLRLLALPYSDHPDHRDEWLPA